jgi:hypothetical protein
MRKAMAANTRIRVYYNIRKKCLSMMDPKTRRVVGYVRAIDLANVKFIVSQPGVERIRREQRKQVVAFVEGEINSLDMPTMLDLLPGMESVTFNPYRHPYFVDVAENAIHSAKRCTVIGNKMFVLRT